MGEELNDPNYGGGAITITSSDSLSLLQPTELFNFSGPLMDSQEIQQLFDKSVLLPAANTDINCQEIHFMSDNSQNGNGMETFQTIDQNYPLKHLTEYPEKDELETECSFNITLNSEDAGKSTWVHSTKLSKVFIKMDTVFAFSIEYKPFDMDLYLRAMIVYMSNEASHFAVNRCPNHQNKPRQGETLDTAMHILRSPHPNAQLLGKPDGTYFGDRLCVLIPLGFKNQELVKQDIRLEFACQNSCNGINRRPTAIIFTLEDQIGRIWGRRYLPFKVCSCPKRDKEKEERDKDPRMPKKRKIEEQQHGKRPAKVISMISQQQQHIKQETIEVLPTSGPVTVAYHHPEELAFDDVLTIRLPNKSSKMSVLRFALGEIGLQMDELPENDPKRDYFQLLKNDIKTQMMDDLKTSDNN